MDRLEAMSLLLAVVEAGSFSAASRRIGVPLPTLSRRIADLEAHLHARLLVRSTRRLALTEAGTAYLAAARRILEQVEEAEQAAAGEWRTPRGELIVTAPVVFGRLHVLPVVAAFLATYPEIDVRLLLSDRNLGLLDDHIDLAVRIGALPDSSFVARPLGSVRRLMVASPAFLDRHGVPQTPDALSSLPCIVYEGLTTARRWTFSDPAGGTITVPIPARLAVNTVEAVIDAAIAGVGVAHALSYQCAAACASGSLVVVLAAFEPPPMPINLLHAGQGALPLKTRSFLDFAAIRLLQGLGGAAPETFRRSPTRR